MKYVIVLIIIQGDWFLITYIEVNLKYGVEEIIRILPIQNRNTDSFKTYDLFCHKIKIYAHNVYDRINTFLKF